MNEERKENWFVVAIVVTVIISTVVPVFIILYTFISTYDSIVDLKVNVKLAEANVESMMENRMLLIPDLVKVVEKYSDHEKEIFENIENTRADLERCLGSNNPSEVNEANINLSIAINDLLTEARKYPTLTSGKQYTALMDSLESSVNKITTARTQYNKMVALYNKKVTTFPGNIIAAIYSFEEIEEFKADDKAKATEIVDFNNK